MCQKVICQIFWWVKSDFFGLESESESFSVGLKSESESTKLFQQRVRVRVRVLQKSPSPSPFCESESGLDPSLMFLPQRGGLEVERQPVSILVLADWFARKKETTRWCLQLLTVLFPPIWRYTFIARQADWRSITSTEFYTHRKMTIEIYLHWMIV